MPNAFLARHFAWRMASLALLAGLLAGAAPPLFYRAAAWAEMHTQAAILARSLAASVRPVAEQQPYLWRYNAPKLVEATAALRGQGALAMVRVTDCAGHVAFESGLGAADPQLFTLPRARAPIQTGGVIVGRVELALTAARQRAMLSRIVVGSSLLGCLLCVGLFLVPTRVVRRQARSLTQTLGELRCTQEDLQAANRDLHDGLGQRLAAAQLDLDAALADEAAHRPATVGNDCEPVPIVPTRSERLSGVVRGAIEELRRVVRELRPVELDEPDLVEALRSLAEGFELATGIATSFRASLGANTCAEPVRVCLLRVLQEALANAARHGHAHEVSVRLQANEGFVELLVRDDGVGFDANATLHGGRRSDGVSVGVPNRHQGMGLRGITERCALLGGRARITSQPGEGTSVQVFVPQRVGESIPTSDA